MATASANIIETPIAGKYGRVLISFDGTLYPASFQKWSIKPATENIDTTNFEDAGWANGITGIVGAQISLSGMLQIQRSGGLAGYAAQILTPGRRIVYELWLAHPDYVSYGSTLRYTGVGQVIDPGAENETSKAAGFQVELASRGPIYFPGQAAPAPSTQLAGFLNVSGGGNAPS